MHTIIKLGNPPTASIPAASRTLGCLKFSGTKFVSISAKSRFSRKGSIIDRCLALLVSRVRIKYGERARDLTKVRKHLNFMEDGAGGNSRTLTMSNKNKTKEPGVLCHLEKNQKAKYEPSQLEHHNQRQTRSLAHAT